MTPEEIIRRCDEQIAISGETALVGFRIPGRWGKTDTRRLWKGGPIGEIVNDFGDGTIYVMFSAVEVKKAVQKILDESTVYGKKLCARCRIFFRKQGEEICEPCMDELILGQPSRNNAWNRFVEEFSDALIRADCRRKQERSEHA